MPSRLTIKQRIENARERGENTLNLSFHLEDIDRMMQILNIKETHGADDLSTSIVRLVNRENLK